MRLFPAVLPILGASLILSGCIIGDFEPSDRYQAPFHYAYDLAPNGHLNLESFNGAVEITGWDENKVEISGTRYASSRALLDSVKIEIHNEPAAIDIRTVRPSEPFSNSGVRYTLRVPRSAVLDHIGTTNGPIRVHDVASGAHLKTSNGTIHAGNLRGPVDAQTTNGAIELTDVDGSATMRTTNGRIHAERMNGQCEAHTSNGSITLSLDSAAAAPLRLTTSNGTIDLTLAHSPKEAIRAETTNGSITVRLPADAGARLEANTSNSSISTEINVNGDVHAVRNHLDGTIGEGGPLLELTTRNGRISLLRD